MAIVACKDISLKSFGKIFTYGQGKWFCELTSLLSEGNTKIPVSTAVFNMSSASSCPSRRLGLCSARWAGVKCYALKSECGLYPGVLPRREAQQVFWLKTSAEDFVVQFLLINALKEKPFTKIRLNESGDFHTQECVDKAEKIAQILSRFGIKVYCYTSREDLDFDKIKHLVVSGSGFKKVGIPNQFNIIHNMDEKPKGFGICKCDCRVCDRCSTRGKNTVVLAH